MPGKCGKVLVHNALQVCALAVDFLLGRCHCGAALLNLLGSRLVYAGKRNEAVQLNPGIECVTLRIVDAILGLAPVVSPTLGFRTVPVRFTGCRFGFHGCELGLQLRVVEPDQQIAGFDAVVELDENLPDDGGRRRTDAKLASLGLNPARCGGSPGGLGAETPRP